MMALPHVILTISSKLVDKTNFVDNCRRDDAQAGAVRDGGGAGPADRRRPRHGLRPDLDHAAGRGRHRPGGRLGHRAPGRAGHHRGVGYLPLALRQRRLADRADDDLPRLRRRVPRRGGAVLDQGRHGQAVGRRHPQRPRCLRPVPLPRQGPRPPAPGRQPAPLALLAPLGLGAGFLDAVGGGGWGPIGTPTLLASGRMEPRKVIGSVDTGEFLVALGASLGFLVSLSWSQVPLSLVLLLLAGGLFAAPLAAWLVKHLAPASSA